MSTKPIRCVCSSNTFRVRIDNYRNELFIECSECSKERVMVRNYSKVRVR